MRDITKSRWPRLSPLLDELLDLAPAARAARLEALRAEDPELADDLQTLLARDEVLASEAFLDAPALPTLTAALLLPGQNVGAYTLEREIGHGGMGSVWLARRTDGRFEGQVAIKFLSSGLLGHGDSGRFAREGQILGRLAHPHIARLIDAGVAPEGHQPYLVLEYIDGLPIDRYCDERQLDVPARVRLFLDVLGAVAHAHNRLILHRDLKPSNILVNQAGEVKLLDFGIAKLLGDATQPAAATELTQRAGNAYTPQYAAPEQVQGGDVTTATDVYALGVLLYMLLGGPHPTVQASASSLERLRAVVETEPKRLSDVVPAPRSRELRGDLDTIVARTLKKAPAERYANAAALAADLRHWLNHEPITARPDSAAYLLSKFVRRHRLGVAAGGTVVLALTLLTGVSFTQAWRAERAEKLALQRSAEADDLLGYMLGEFADKLRPIGRLELLDSVGSKALDHLAKGGDEADVHARLQRAKALTVIGEVRVSKRDLDTAMAPLLAARKLLAGAPPDAGLLGEWHKAQGAAAFWIGHISYTKRQFAAARSAFEDYRDYSAAWLAQAPQQYEALVESSYAQNSLGTVLLDSGDLLGAAKLFQGSIELKRQALLIKPQDLTLRMDLANSMSWRGTALLWQGEFAGARQILDDGVALIAEVRASAAKDWTWIHRDALMRLWLAQSLESLQQPEAAARELREADRLLSDLLRQEPGNQRWAVDLITVKAAAAGLRSSRELRQSALAGELIQRLDGLDQTAGENVALRRLHIRAQAVLLQARALQDGGQTTQAQALLNPLLERLEAALKKRPEDLRLRSAAARTQLALSHAAGAAAAQQHCQAVLTGLGDLRPLLTVHYEITKAWVDSHSCLGRDGEVRREREWLASKTKLPT